MDQNIPMQPNPGSLPAPNIFFGKEAIGGGSSRRHDPLLSCLIEIARIHGRGMTPESFLSGLPLPEGLLTPSLFRRAAIRADLASRISRRPLSAVRAELLPAILLLDGNDACVLLDFNPTRTKARVLFSEAGQGETEIPIERLEALYTGYTIFVRPRFRFDERAPEIRNIVQRHWFWGAMVENLPLYRDALLAAFLINLAALAIPFFTLNVYDRVIPNNAIETLWTLAIGVLLLVVVDFGLRMARSRVIDLAGKRVDLKLSSYIMERVLGMQLAHRPASTGSFAQNLRTFESVRDFITSATITAFIDLPFAIIFLALIFWLGWQFGVVITLAMAAYLTFAILLQPTLQALTETTQRAGATRNATLIESLVGLETVKTQCAEGVMQRRWEQSVAYLAKVGSELRNLTALISNSTGTIQQVTTTLIIIVGVYLIGERSVTQGALIACTMLASRALGPFTQIAGLLSQYQNSVLGLAGLDKIMQQPVERPEKANFIRRDRLAGDIEFDQVTFGYPNSAAHVLRNISFKITAGERVAFIGRVGSGKSTISRLILGLYQPASGRIKLDGIDAGQLDPAEVRKAIGYVPQDIVLFFGSLRDNITLGMPHVEDYGILQASQIAGLEDLVGNHQAGFDMLIGERGESLSGGQRQQVAIARAIVHEPNVLLLDEPTSSMDTTSEEALKGRLKDYARGRTMVLVTHRASLLDLVDRIIVLDHGQIVADGRKDVILAALKSGKIGSA